MSIKRIYRDGKPLNNVAAGGSFTGVIDVGSTLENVKFKLAGIAPDFFTPAHITLLEILANTKTVMVASGADFKKINAYKGLAPDDNYLDLSFVDPTSEGNRDRLRGAFDTTLLGVNGTLTIKGDISAVADTPTLGIDLLESAPQIFVGNDGQTKEMSVRREIGKLLRTPINVANGGEVVQGGIPYGPNGTQIKRLFFITAGGKLDKVEIKEGNGRLVHKSVRLANEAEQKRWGLVPQANMYVIDFCLDGNFDDLWDTRGLQAIDVRCTYSGAETGWCYMEILDAVDNL